MPAPSSSRPFSDLLDAPFDTGIRARGPLGGKAAPLLVSDPSRATMYVCGVTVYDHCHLGHARSAAAFDLIARHLRAKVGSLAFARNVTDVDDKIINRAKERGMDWRELALSMEASMREDFAALGCLPPDFEPRATDHIPQMLGIVAELLARGLAYVGPDGSVWRDGATWDGLGRISGKVAADLIGGARAASHPGKRSDSDFVLWKAAKPGEPSWSAPWGAGRPGWHIECSAMSREALGDSLDIHGGGEDLKFPHHECECAQSEPLTGKPLARHWIHNGFVVLPKSDGQAVEMHKSSGNALNIKGLLAKHPGEAIRAWALSAHYRAPLPYADEALDAARARAWRWALAREAALAGGADPFGTPDPRIVAALDNDFNSPLAFAALDALAKQVRADPSDKLAGSALAGSLASLGMGFTKAADLAPEGALRKIEQAQDRAPAEIEALIQARAEAREAKDWARSDKIRDEIKALGYEVNDAPGAKPKKP